MNILADFARRHPRQAAQFKEAWQPLFQRLLASDRDQIPDVNLREGYYAGQNTDYWVSGALDALKAIDDSTRGTLVLPPAMKILDLGCSSGRVLRARCEIN